MRATTCILSLVLLGPGVTWAQDSPSRRMLQDYLLSQAQKHFDARRAVIAGLKTPDDIHKRQKQLRDWFIESLGGFPEKTPLNAQIVGKELRDGYRIEKLICESRPQHHVTATLYLPEGKGPFPGVLMPIGHSTNGKAADYVQRGAILLAKNGLAVLTYDPIGQGERRQLLDRQGKAAIPGSTTEHTLTGIGALLVGQNTATYRIWDGIRSLDYLVSRPEIDATRIGCTGCSGGGTETSYLMALDERITAAAPSCYVTSLERLFATIGPQDAEQNITGQVAAGLEHADYLFLRAPRPTLICAATRDFFDIQGTWTSFREAKRTYGLLGFGERVDLFESDTGHGFPRSQREATVRFMRRWLLGKDDTATEPDFPIVKDAELQCTRTGQVLEDFKGKSVFHFNAERAELLAKKRGKRQLDQKTPDLLKEVAQVIGVTLPVRAAASVEPGNVKAVKNGTRLLFKTEPGIIVPGVLLLPETEKPGPLVIHLNATDRAADPSQPQLRELLGAGSRVLTLDLRGLGETAPGTAKQPSHFGVDFKEAYLGLHLNRPLLGQRTSDVLAVIEALASRSGYKEFVLIGPGKAGPVALHAAALEPRIKGLILDRSLASWTSVVLTPISFDQLTNVVPGVLAVYDLPELAATLAPRQLTIRQPADPTGKALDKEMAERIYAPVREAYRRSKAEAELKLE